MGMCLTPKRGLPFNHCIVLTRFCVNTAKILYLIFKNSKYIQTSGSWGLSISDHEPVFIVQRKSVDLN